MRKDKAADMSRSVGEISAAVQVVVSRTVSQRS